MTIFDISYFFSAGLICALVLCLPVTGHGQPTSENDKFETLGKQYIEEFPAFSPVKATYLGDHRYDDQLDDVGEQARQRKLHWFVKIEEALKAIDRSKLSRENQVDYALMKHSVESQKWEQQTLQEWAWNPLEYTEITGSAVYSLMARDFAPVSERLHNVGKRLQQFPRFLSQVRETLDPKRVPAVHAKTALAQNRGVLKSIENFVVPQLDQLPDIERRELLNAIELATSAVHKHQEWLEKELLPNAKGNYQLGVELYEQKLKYSLHSPLRRPEIRQRSESFMEELHEQMYEIAKMIYLKQYPLTEFPESPSKAYRRVIIRYALEKAYDERPRADEIVSTAEKAVADATRFVKQNEIITLMPDPLQLIVMPEYRRGVSLAYCDSPGPLETDQPTFYAVSPPPVDWTTEQVDSHLREYNNRSMDILTIHEAIPGHFTQIAHANRFPGMLRHMFQSGTFIEGWAVYSEGMLCDEGFRDHDPLLKLISLKWYLRDITNALIDQAIHVDGISRSKGMQLMIEEGFQEEREAAAKWTRAQLTSAQLSTYLVGYLEHNMLRQETEEAWGKNFVLKTYHDKLLSFGSPPPQFARALLRDLPIPE